MAEQRWTGPFGEERAEGKTARRYLVILNTPIKQAAAEGSGRNRLFDRLWADADCRICADGGANRLYDYAIPLAPPLVPHHIVGDLDSIRSDVKHFFRHRAAVISSVADQDSTDLAKSLALIHTLHHQQQQHHPETLTAQVVIHGGLTGRLDQTIHTLHTLLLQLHHPLSPIAETWVVDTDAGSMACALQRGLSHHLPIPPTWRQGPTPLTCGILPIGVSHACLTTKGLKWNLDRATSSITGLLSTSNHILPDAEAVQVASDEDVIWTHEIPEWAMY